MKRLLSLLLALVLLLCGCGKPQTGGAVTLWCASDDPLLPAIRAAAEDYGYPVALREFADGEALQNALNTARPDLLLCSHTLAFRLAGKGLLAISASAVRYPDALAGRDESIGRSVFPIGSRVQLLLRRDAEAPTDFLSLCAWASAQKRPCFAADSYADLICQAMLGAGEFHADREKDCFSPAFQTAWNALAECAFSGSLYTGAAQRRRPGGLHPRCARRKPPACGSALSRAHASGARGERLCKLALCRKPHRAACAAKRIDPGAARRGGVRRVLRAASLPAGGAAVACRR